MGKERPPLPPDIEGGPRPRRGSQPPPPTPPHFCPPPQQSWFPWLVPLIFLANVGLFIFLMYINDCPSKLGPHKCLFEEYLGRFSFQPIKENLLLGPAVITLKNLGALERQQVVQQRQLWRLFSCMWLHAGVVHLATNMISLLLIGVRMEQDFGFFRIGVLYVLSGFGGSLMSALTLPETGKTVSVGASGALFGLLGAMLSELLTNWTIYSNKCSTLMSLILIIGLNLAIGLLPNVDNSAHIGGFLSGLLLGFILLMRPQYGYVSKKYIPAGYSIKHKKPKHKCYQYFLWIVALIMLIAGYAYGLTRLLKGETVDHINFNRFHQQQRGLS